MLISTKLYYLDAVNSTNEYAKELLTKGVPEGTVVLADAQTEGKGRFGKQWYSPEGGLWMSAILHPSNPTLIPIAAAVAVCEALHINGILPGIKWPNDIILNGKKIAGILVEIIDEWIVVGIGLNLNIRKFPEELVDTASSVFLETKKHLEKKMVFDHICKHLDDSYIMLQNNQGAELLTKWRHYTILLGQKVTIEMGDTVIHGKVLDISSDGALVVMNSDGKIQRVPGGVCHLSKDRQ
ncbi:biotin--[acetyl-CoA-carboxylase] ligase [candidate division WOR-3 bacterium]|nr:biotin--[acetyl-CoA-carboxylase] ligase [candidate division WOR-3 bacterium]